MVAPNSALARNQPAEQTRDGDIVLPQRRMVVVGTTSFEVDSLDYVPVFEDHVKLISAVTMIPALREQSTWKIYGHGH
jgi:glycerol-3-phosphate dehydrogenase